MQIIKDKQIIDDPRSFIADDSPLAAGDICVSLQRWQNERQNLLAHDGKLGVRLNSSDEVAELSDDLDNIALIELEFPAFTDGRPFSQARLLKSRLNYQGEIRAVGNFMIDQAFYLMRVGFNALQLNNENELNQALKNLNDFSVQYQASSC